MDYKDKMIIGDVYDGEAKYFHYGKVACSFRNITVDASKKFPNLISERLEPYDMNEMVEFKDFYLAGIDAKFADDSMHWIAWLRNVRGHYLSQKQ